MKFQDSDMPNYSLMKSKKLEKCIICKEETQYIEYCCEGRLCSSDCHNVFYEKLKENN